MKIFFSILIKMDPIWVYGIWILVVIVEVVLNWILLACVFRFNFAEDVIVDVAIYINKYIIPCWISIQYPEIIRDLNWYLHNFPTYFNFRNDDKPSFYMKIFTMRYHLSDHFRTLTLQKCTPWTEIESSHIHKETKTFPNCVRISKTERNLESSNSFQLFKIAAEQIMATCK